MEHDIRPWGQYWVLQDEDTFKVKRIEVNPAGRLSYQYHHKRAEVWTIVEGKDRITLNGEVKNYKAGEVAIIPFGARHRIENPFKEPLVFSKYSMGLILEKTI